MTATHAEEGTGKRTEVTRPDDEGTLIANYDRLVEGEPVVARELTPIVTNPFDTDREATWAHRLNEIHQIVAERDH